MISAWTDHLQTQEDKKRFQDGLRESPYVKRLQELMKKDLDGLSRKERSSKVYDSPNWENRQAHANGYMSCLQEYLTLLNLDHKDKDEHVVRPGINNTDRSK
jgi:hypothetical protein